MALAQASARLPAPHRHGVHFYGSDHETLATEVADYLAAGLRAGHTAIVIAERHHVAQFRAGLEQRDFDVATLVSKRRLVLADAFDMLGQFMVDGQPDEEKFKATVGAAVRDIVRAKTPLRAYGEMVGILWSSGQRYAAMRLEQMWNELLGQVPFDLFCGYPIDPFGKDFDLHGVDEIMCTHTHVQKIRRNGELRDSVDRAINTILGEKSANIRPLIKPNYRPAWAALPEAESTILWLRNNLPEYAEEIVALAKSYFHEGNGRSPAAEPAPA